MKTNIKAQLVNLTDTLVKKLQDRDYDVDEYEVYVKHEIHNDKFDLYVTVCNYTQYTVVELIRKDGHDTGNVEEYMKNWLDDELYDYFRQVERDLAKEEEERATEAEFERAWQTWHAYTLY